MYIYLLNLFLYKHKLVFKKKTVFILIKSSLTTLFKNRTKI